MFIMLPFKVYNLKVESLFVYSFSLKLEKVIFLCNSGHKMNALLSDVTPKYVYVITPTYTRATQQAELNLLSQALNHVPYLQVMLLPYPPPPLFGRNLTFNPTLSPYRCTIITLD